MATQQADARPAPQPVTKTADGSESLLDKIVAQGTLGERRDELIIRKVEFDQKQRLARMFVKSQCFRDVDKDEDGSWLPEDVSIARAMLKIEMGEAMGFSPAESMNGIDIIKGRTAVGAHLRAARMQRAGFGWPAMICTDKGCIMPLEFQGKPMMHQKVDESGNPVFDAAGKPVMVQIVVRFTEADAAKLNLLDKTASMYKKDPSSMYYARTVTRAQRRYAPAVLSVNVLDTYEAVDVETAQPDIVQAETPQLANAASEGLKGRLASAPVPVPDKQFAATPEAKPVEKPKVEPKPEPKKTTPPPVAPPIEMDRVPTADEGVPGQEVLLPDGHHWVKQDSGEWKDMGKMATRKEFF